MTGVRIRERKKRNTRRRIMDAAGRLFGERGIADVNVEEIAVAADVGKGTIYNYFDAKEDIAGAILIELDYDAIGTIALLPTDGMSAADALDAAAWSLLEHKADYRDFVRAFLARTLGPGSFALDQAEFQAMLDAAIGGVMERLLSRPGSPTDASVPDLILSFKTLHFGISAVWALEGPPFTAARQLARRHMTFLAKELEP